MTNAPFPADQPFDCFMEGVEKRFQGETVLGPIDLALRRGSILALIGPNGAGKTTTLRLLGGLLHADGGCVSTLGHDPSLAREKVMRRIGMTVSPESLFEGVTVYEHLLMMGEMHDMPRREAARRTESLLRVQNLWQARHQEARIASIGQKKRLLLALALIHQPELLLLDEPFEALDPKAVRSTIELLQRFRASGRSVIVAGHLLDILQEVVDDFVFFQAGKVIGRGGIAQLANDHQSLSNYYFQTFMSDQDAVPNLEWLWSPRC